jgi:hypothetical protein
MNDCYIYTEIANCGKIGRIAIDSFHKYHNYKVHVYGTKEDFKWIKKHNNNVFIELENNIIDGFRQGHLGTALLWKKVILECPSDYLIHFDSDVIFRANIVDKMIELSSEYDLIGPIRNYHHNPNNRNDVRHLTDLVQTDCFLFNKKKISQRYLKNNWFNKNCIFYGNNLNLNSFIQFFNAAFNLIRKKNKIDILTKMIQGTLNPLGFPIIDFFDPVMFDMITNGARIYHINSDDVGGCNFYGKRDNDYKEINDFPTPYKIDFGNKLAHFSSVGSGMNFYLNRDKIYEVSDSYIDYAIDRYALFCKIFYGEDIPGIDLSSYKKIVDIAEWY